MNTIVSDLCALCTAGDIAAVVSERLRGYTDEVRQDNMGNVLAIRRHSDPDAPTVMLEAHMDEVGFLVTRIDDNGFVRVDKCGSPDERVLAGQRVLIDGQYPGVFCSVPPHMLREGAKRPAFEDMGIDAFMPADEARQKIAVGSRVSFAPAEPHLLGASRICAKSLDDRAGVAAILYALRRIKEPRCHIAVAICVQEELGCRGAAVATRGLCPDEALVTDVSFALTPDADPVKCGKLSAGVMIGISPVLDERVTKKLFSLAEEHKLPYQTEVMGGSTGTDADSISKTATGVKTGLLSIPERYMHTPNEIVDVRDIAAVGDLMAVYCEQGGVGRG